MNKVLDCFTFNFCIHLVGRFKEHFNHGIFDFGILKVGLCFIFCFT